MEKLPAFPFYPGDWLRDEVAGCSLAAQGLWLRMMMIMHDSERYGYLCIDGVPMQPDSIAQRCGARSLAEFTTLMTELENARVPSRTKEGIIFSRRMVRDAKKRLIARKNGRKGGNPSLKNVVNREVNPPLKMKVNKSSLNGDGCREGVELRSKAAQETFDRLVARSRQKEVNHG